MNNVRHAIALAVMLTLSGLAWGADLAGSKSAGLIGERADGYIGFVSASPPADVVELVQSINDQRRAEYERIAAQNGITREQVEALAGQKATDRTPSGEFVFLNGGWSKKP